MEFVIGFALVAVLMLCLGFGLGDVLMLLILVLGLGIVFLGVFFGICLALAATSKRKLGTFNEISEETRFPCAVYDIDGEKVPNLFPSEMIMRNKLYVKDKEVKLLYCAVRRSAIDANALLTIICGSVIFIPASFFAVFKIIELFFGTA